MGAKWLPKVVETPVSPKFLGGLVSVMAWIFN